METIKINETEYYKVSEIDLGINVSSDLGDILSSEEYAKKVNIAFTFVKDHDYLQIIKHDLSSVPTKWIIWRKVLGK